MVRTQGRGAVSSHARDQAIPAEAGGIEIEQGASCPCRGDPAGRPYEWLVLHSPMPASKMNYHFNWSVLWSGQSGAWLLQGLVTTVELSVLAWLLAVTLGIISGALRTVSIPPLRWPAAFYVEF